MDCTGRETTAGHVRHHTSMRQDRSRHNTKPTHNVFKAAKSQKPHNAHNQSIAVRRIHGPHLPQIQKKDKTTDHTNLRRMSSPHMSDKNSSKTVCSRCKTEGRARQASEQHSTSVRHFILELKYINSEQCWLTIPSIYTFSFTYTKHYSFLRYQKIDYISSLSLQWRG